jgi:hypothetical protein
MLRMCIDFILVSYHYHPIKSTVPSILLTPLSRRDDVFGDSYFLDANVLAYAAYANDPSNERKQEVAIRLITDGIRTGRAIIFSQVLSEFWVTAT